MKNCTDCKHDDICGHKDNDDGISLFGGSCIWFGEKSSKEIKMINADKVEPVTFDEIAYLHIRCFTNKITKKKTHYYPRLYMQGLNSKYPYINITYILDEKTAKILNNKDKADGYFASPQLKTWDETIRFNRKHEAIHATIKYLRKNRPDIKVLIDGEPGKCYPQYVIFGPDEFKYVNNELYESFRWSNTKDESVKLWKSFFKYKK